MPCDESFRCLFKKNGKESIKWTSSGIITVAVVVILSGGNLIDWTKLMNWVWVFIIYVIVWFALTLIFTISEVNSSKNNGNLSRILDINARWPAIFGLAFIIVGIIFFYYYIDKDQGTLFVTIGIGFFTYAIAAKSEKIIKKIKTLVTKTNHSIEKTNEQINETKELIFTIGIRSVLDGIGEINDWRLTLRDKLIKISSMKQPISPILRQDYINQHSFTFWKTLTIINKIFHFKAYMGEEEQNSLIHEIDCLFLDLIDGKIVFNIDILDNYKNQLNKIYDKLASLNKYKDKPKRAERMEVNLKFLRGEIDYYMEWKNKPIYPESRKETKEKK